MRALLSLVLALAAAPTLAADGFVYTYAGADAAGQPKAPLIVRFTEDLLIIDPGADGGVIFDGEQLYVFDGRFGRYLPMSEMMGSIAELGEAAEGAGEAADPFAEARAQMEEALSRIPAGPQRDAARKALEGMLPPPIASAPDGGVERRETGEWDELAMGDCQRVQIIEGDRLTMEICVSGSPTPPLGHEALLEIAARMNAWIDETAGAGPIATHNPLLHAAALGGAPLQVIDYGSGEIETIWVLDQIELSDIEPPAGVR